MEMYVCMYVCMYMHLLGTNFGSLNRWCGDGMVTWSLVKGVSMNSPAPASAPSEAGNDDDDEDDDGGGAKGSLNKSNFLCMSRGLSLLRIFAFFSYSIASDVSSFSGSCKNGFGNNSGKEELNFT